VKSQAVRLVDVLVLGPFMMWAASRRELPEWARLALFVAGGLTVAYNGRNWLEARR
jgi:hypothetical protein